MKWILYDKEILTILRDEKSRTFQQLLSEAGFSHNTLRKHLNERVDQDLVSKRKRHQKSSGRSLVIMAYRERLREQYPRIWILPLGLW
jgi:predicted ArsR family transcriptional regulator